MKITKMEADLYCVNCVKNTLHDVTYLGDNIKEIVCTECKATLEIDDKLVLSAYAADIFERIRTKPERMNKEMREDLSKFLRSITVRVITKPYRMIKEFKSIKDTAE
ncbi:MAG: bh protein [Clostridia bacterium]